MTPRRPVDPLVEQDVQAPLVDVVRRGGAQERVQVGQAQRRIRHGFVEPLHELRLVHRRQLAQRRSLQVDPSVELAVIGCPRSGNPASARRVAP